MAAPAAKHDLELLAVLSQVTNFLWAAIAKTRAGVTGRS